MTIKIWDIETNECLKTLSGHTDSVLSVSWSPLLLGQKIASSSYDRTVKIWDAETYTCLGTLNGHQSNVLSVGWSPLLFGQKISNGVT